MRILYLDDSGKVHPNDPSKFAVFAGFSIGEDSWHEFVRRISGAKSNIHPNRGHPNGWEMKGSDMLDPNSWKRKKNRSLCSALPKILRSQGCFVYSVSIEKAKANDSLHEEKFVALAFQRLIAKFNHEINANDTTGSVVCDWSTHQMDRHLTNCINTMVISKYMLRLRGGITYGSSRALNTLQVADLIAGTIRRSLEGNSYLDAHAKELVDLRYKCLGQQDALGFPVDSVFKIF